MFRLVPAAFNIECSCHHRVPPARRWRRRRRSFARWLEGVKRDAMPPRVYHRPRLMMRSPNAQYLPRVIELDRKQPEKTQTIEEYLEKIVSDKRIKDGRAAMAEHKQLLHKIGKEYHVAPKYIVALWGIETNYGKNTGGYSTINALATLAYDGRRSEFFRRRAAEGPAHRAAGRHPGIRYQRLMGGRAWGSASLCRPASCAMPWIIIKTANAISGVRSRMCSPPSPITCIRSGLEQFRQHRRKTQGADEVEPVALFRDRRDAHRLASWQRETIDRALIFILASFFHI
jgi:hypothetical protein